jgi:uncharacterized membrane protein YebE (DUF533 family)
MKTQDVLLLGIGIGIGYLAFKKYQQNKPKKDTTTPPTQASMQKSCEEQWTEKSATMKISGDALATAKVNFLLTCSPVLIATV